MKIKLKLNHSAYEFITNIINVSSLTCNSSHNKILKRKRETKNARRKKITRKTL